MSPDQADKSRDTELLDGEDLAILGEVREVFDRVDPVPFSRQSNRRSSRGRIARASSGSAYAPSYAAPSAQDPPVSEKYSPNACTGRRRAPSAIASASSS